MNTFIALIKREVSEHNNLWKVPMVLLVIAILIKLSFSFGNLSLDFEVPDGFNIDSTVDSFLATAIGKVLGYTNWLISGVMFLVAVFYALSSLYDERQDQSVLFWRSLPISDTQTILAKLAVALVLVPVLILLMQSLVAVVFLGTQSVDYLASYMSFSVSNLGRALLWSMLPTISWCLLCSQIANKSPFLIALVVPLLVTIVDWLFLNGIIGDTFVINRFNGIDHYTPTVLVVGVIFSIACLSFGDNNCALDIQAFTDPNTVVNLSVWESVDALSAFVYRNTDHRNIMRRRTEWFDEVDFYLVLWWVPEGHIPSVQEAKQKLELLSQIGPSEQAFTFKDAFPAPA